MLERLIYFLAVSFSQTNFLHPNAELYQLIPPVYANQSSNFNSTTTVASFGDLLAGQILYGVLLGLFLLLNFTLWITSCFLRNKQPLKSRGSFHFLFLFLLLGFVVVPFLVAFLSQAISEAANNATNSLTQKPTAVTSNNISCLFSMFLLDPIIYGIFILFIARTARYSFILHINKLKNRIFRETKLQDVEQVIEKQKTNTMKKRAAKRRPSLFSATTPSSPSSDMKRELSTMPSFQQVHSELDDVKSISSAFETSQQEDTNTEKQKEDGDATVMDDDLLSYDSDMEDMMNQEEELQISKQLKSAMFRLKLLKLLVSEWFLLFIVLVCIGFWELIMILTSVASLGADRCISDVPRYIGIVYLTMIVIAYILLAIVDVSLSRKTVCSKQCALYCSNSRDLYQFRIEYAITMPIILPFMIWIVLVDIIPALQYYFTLYPWIHIIIFMSLLHLLQFVFCGYIVIVTLVQTIREIVRSKNGSTEQKAASITRIQSMGVKEVVDYIMQNEKLRLLFKQQAKREWSLENYQIYLAIRDFQRLPTNSRSARLKQRRLADKIYGTFVMSNSIMEVNLSNGVREGCRSAIHKSYGKPIAPNFFDQVLDEVKVNLGDTASRFFFTNEFSRYYEGQQLKEKMMSQI